MGSTSPAGVKPSSRTVELGKMAMGALLLLSAQVPVALYMGVAGDDLHAVAEVIGTLAMSVSLVGTGAAVGHGARHWGAAEPSGGRTG